MSIPPNFIPPLPSIEQPKAKVIKRSISESIDAFIKQISEILNPEADLGYETPFFIDKTVYLIDHSYRGAKVDPIILDSSKVSYQANQPHYETDVYHYTDNKTDTTVYYDAITRRLLGFKPRHKEYVDNDQGGYYLKINHSVRDKLALMAYPSQVVENNVARGHIVKLKQAIDTFCSIISQAKYGADEGIASRYQMDINIEPIIEWSEIRDSFVYQPVKGSSDAMVLNKQGLGANLYSWLSDMLVNILDQPNNTAIAQLLIAIINHIYETNNTDIYRQTFALQRFYYVINGSNMLDRFAKHGYDEPNTISQEEAEQRYDDLQQAEALDIETYEEGDEWMNANDS